MRNAARNLAEAPATYAKDAVERSAMAADGAFNVVEQFHAKAGKGAKDLNIHFIAAARGNTNAAFDFAQQLMAVCRRRNSSSCRAARTQTVRNAQ